MKRHTGRFSYSVYMAGLATVFCGLCALNSVLSDSAFVILVGSLLITGYTTSIILRYRGYTARLVELAVIVAGIAVYVQLIGGEAVSEAIVPSAALEAPELRLAVMLLWLEVLRSFTLVSDESVTFSSIPSVVLISLVATNNVNPEIMAIFIVYLVLTAFLLVHNSDAGRTELKPGFRIAIVISVLALIIGSVVVIPVRFACTKAFSAAMPEFTRIKDRLSLSGYSDTNSIQIAQGPVRLSKEVVMTVKSRMVESGEVTESYWRGRVFDRYTGRGWKVSVPYVRMVRSDKEGARQPDGRLWYQYGSLPAEKDRLLDQIVRARPIFSREVCAAAEPVLVQVRCRNLARNSLGCWHGIFTTDGTVEYHVVSLLPNTDPSQLRKADDDFRDVSPIFYQTITSNKRAGDLARRITHGKKNQYDRVRAIEQYLGENFTYDLDAPSTPPGVDAVDYFLFTSKVGYCDIFASSMVIMCREIGIPARLATGFATGVYDRRQECFKVRDMDRHAWAEVYFPGCGWATFDPTALTRTSNFDRFQQFVNSMRRVMGDLFGGVKTLPFVIGLLFIGAVMAFGSEIKRIRFHRRPSAPSKLHAVVIARYMKLCKQLRSTDTYLTPSEVAMSANSRDAKAIALRAAKLFGEIRYGGRDVCISDIKELDRLNREIRSALKRA